MGANYLRKIGIIPFRGLVKSPGVTESKMNIMHQYYWGGTSIMESLRGAIQMWGENLIKVPTNN